MNCSSTCKFLARSLRIVTILREDQKHAASKTNSDRSRLEGRLTALLNRIDAAYMDKLDGKITEEVWGRKMADWRLEEHHVKLALDAVANAETEDRALSAERTLELANKAYLLYVSQDSFEKAKLLRILLSNCSMDAVSATPAYRYPFELIFKRAQTEELVGTTRFELATSPTIVRIAKRNGRDD